ncbi:hypothetical protein AVEN_208673-1 [Araneus ventricosus]|uniref:Uncharacterized protein n=1 Tax=Araneus ventricosus TaxID=182803 RepID=A0A4Y2DVW6_ARAVE|nr:hypothetical protein AVEN_208673-1 [Araneus ventricosus]
MPRCWSSTHHQREGTSETVPLGKAKSVPDSGSTDNLIQCRSKRRCFTLDTVGYGTVQQTSHLCASVDQASSSTMPTVGPGTLRLDHG